MLIRHVGRRLPAVLFAALLTLSCGYVPSQTARTRRSQPAPNPFDFSQFMDQMFGRETEADRKALEKVNVSLAEEKQIGEQGVQQYLADLKRQGINISDDSSDALYVKRLVKIMQKHMKNRARYPDIKVYLVESDTTDARSFPGGNLVFFRGILDFAPSEAAFIGVVGHELAHLDHGHQLNHVRRIKLAQQSFSGGRGANWQQMMANGMSMVKAFARPFRPEEEAEADQDAVRWMHAEGYDPKELAKLFAKMDERNADRRQAPFEFLRTHPSPSDRSAAVEETLRGIGRRDRRVQYYVGKENLERRITRDEQRFDE